MNGVGRVVLITGAAHGIGRAVAHRLADAGVRLALADLDGDAARSVAAELGQDRTLAMQVDVTDWAQVEAMVGQTTDSLGRLDGLVNAAGGMSGLGHPHRRTLEGLSIEEWDQAFALNVKSVFLCTRAAVPALREAGGGSIVSIASSAARNGSTTAGPAYVASKSAIIGLTRNLALMLAPDRIRVNAVAPGGTESERFLAVMAQRTAEERERGRRNIPLGRNARPAEIAAAIGFLLRDESSYMTGTTIDVNGGVFVG
jgi:NAD(P)-dependent dehydrogenase (short-subunit alcohol dehydrogenase family)